LHAAFSDYVVSDFDKAGFIFVDMMRYFQVGKMDVVYVRKAW